MTKTMKTPKAETTPIHPIHPDIRDHILDLRERICILEGFLHGSLRVIEGFVTCDTKEARAALQDRLDRVPGEDKVNEDDVVYICSECGVTREKARRVLALYQGDLPLTRKHLSIDGRGAKGIKAWTPRAGTSP